MFSAYHEMNASVTLLIMTLCICPNSDSLFDNDIARKRSFMRVHLAFFSSLETLSSYFFAPNVHGRGE